MFFDDIIRSECYCEEILHPLIGHLNEDEIAGGYFRQDGATAHAHTTCVSVTLLRNVFENTMISNGI